MARVLLSLPDEFLNKVDKIAGSEQRTRSELIREALRAYIKRSSVIDIEKSNKNAQLLEELLD